MSYSTSSDQSAMTTQSNSTPMSATSVPDLVRIGQIPTNTAIDIETDILDPVVHTDTFCRFQFQNKGILHSNSKIVLRLKTSSTDAFVPAGIGIHSLIERCALRVGTKTISEIDDFNHYIGYKSMFLSNEHQKQRESFVSGRRVAHKPYYDEGTGTSFTGTLADVTVNAPTVGLDNGTSVNASGGTVDLYADPHVTNNDEYGVEFAVSIQDLFPFLYQNQLPLFMMTEPVTIELFFSPASKNRMCLSATDAGDTGLAFAIDTTATELVADYQYFPQEMMAEYARQNANLSFTYMDYRLAKRTVVANASGAETTHPQIILNVGGAGRLCTKTFTCLSNDSITDVSMLNNYHSVSMFNKNGTAPGKLVSNLKYNDHFLYPVDVENSAQQFHNVVQGEGMVPFVTRDEYSNQGGTMTPALYEGHAQSDSHSGLTGQFFYQVYKLNRNERINSRGIELYNIFDKIENKKAAEQSFTLRTYLELIRVATLKDGVMETAFA